METTPVPDIGNDPARQGLNLTATQWSIDRPRPGRLIIGE
jgi:hypothetical protein